MYFSDAEQKVCLTQECIRTGKSNIYTKTSTAKIDILHKLHDRSKEKFSIDEQFVSIRGVNQKYYM